MNPLQWLFVKGAASAAKAALGKIPLAPPARTKRVRFRDVPIGGHFVNLGAGDKWVRVSHDEACPLDPDWMREKRFPFPDIDDEVEVIIG